MKSKSKNMYETINKTDLYPFGQDLLDFNEVLFFALLQKTVLIIVDE